MRDDTLAVSRCQPVARWQNSTANMLHGPAHESATPWARIGSAEYFALDASLTHYLAVNGLTEAQKVPARDRVELPDC